MLGSALSASLSTVIGHMTDRRGPYLPLIAGLVIGAPLMALLVVPQAALPLAVLMVITFGGPLTFSMIPAASLMTDSAEARRRHAGARDDAVQPRLRAGRDDRRADLRVDRAGHHATSCRCWRSRC